MGGVTVTVDSEYRAAPIDWRRELEDVTVWWR